MDERLSPEEVQAVTSHLLTNVKALRRSTTLDRDEMAQLVRRSRVVEIRRKSKNPHSDKIRAGSGFMCGARPRLMLPSC